MARAVPGWREAETHLSVSPVRCEATLSSARLHPRSCPPTSGALVPEMGVQASSSPSSEACDGVEGR